MLRVSFPVIVPWTALVELKLSDLTESRSSGFGEGKDIQPELK